jgi:hypothetical protein
MTPYKHPVTPIRDVSKYFKKDEKTSSILFIGDSLELRIPLKFKQHGVLTVSDNVTTPGIMDMIFDDKYQAGLNILAAFTIIPSEIDEMTYDGIDYLVLRLKKGDTFMTSYRVIQDPYIVYVLWTEFITYGGIIYTLDYDALLKLFAHVYELTGGGIGVSRPVYEGIIAHLARDPDNISKQYRLTDMKKKMSLVALKSVSQAPTGTVARLNGSFFKTEGVTAALRHQVNEHQPFEDLLRGLPSGINENPDGSVS